MVEGKIRKPGLVHGLLRVEVEEVKPAHKVVCAMCGVRPLCGTRRLVVGRGSGRAAKREVYCQRDGVDVLVDLQRRYQRAGLYLGGAPSLKSIRTRTGP